MSAGVDLLEGEAGFRRQLALWGYVVQGDICETAAITAEQLHRDERLWDRTAADLAGWVISHADEPYRRVKDWAALPWMTEHVLRQHLEWPGL